MAAQKARAEAESRAAQAEAELAAETKRQANRAIEAALRPERERLQQLAEDLVIRQGELESESAIAVEEQKKQSRSRPRGGTRGWQTLAAAPGNPDPALALLAIGWAGLGFSRCKRT